MVNERQPSTITTTITIKLNLTSFLRLLIVLNLIESLFALTLTDYGFDQSIAYKFLPPGERRQLQRQMLNLLGLDHRPKPKKKDTFSSFYLRDLYQSYFDEDTANLIDGHYHPIVIEGEILSKPSISAINESDVIVSFVNQYNRSVKHSKHGKDRKFWFDTSEISPESNVISAELRLFRNHTGFQKDSFEIYKLHIYSISNEHEMPTSRLVASKVITHERGWLMFNVTGAIQDWIIYPEHNHGLYLAIYSSSTGKELEPKDIGIVGGGRGARDKQPFILAFFKSQSNSLHRTKRDAKKSQYSEVSTYDTYGEFNPYFDRRYTSGRSCQKKSLYVSFKDLGWQDWIIAPDGYAAFFCDGECSFPLNAHMNATNHAIVQTLVHLMNPSSVPKPCCAPTKLSSIMVLYFDDNSNVILKKYKNMVVKSCGCH